jgi:restriction endonuclease Mrr
MPQRQVQAYRRQQKLNKSNNGSGCIGTILTIILFVVILGIAVNSLSTPAGQTFLYILIIGVPVFFIWKYYRKKKQQQQKYEYLQWQRQERELFERQSIEREKQEYERRMHQHIETLMHQHIEKERKVKSIGEMLAFTPREFEEFTGRILANRGLKNVNLIGGSGDLGADIIGFDGDGKKVIVQCKRYAPGQSVGSPAIQSFIGMMNVHHKAEKGIFVTTSTFTSQAIDLAKEHPILLINGDSLVKLAKNSMN